MAPPYQELIMKSMRTIAVALMVLCLRAQSALTPDLDVLTKIRTRMIFNLQHQPNYTCVETIERSTRTKLTSKLKIIDTLRLEVALVDGKELFAWPGSKKFEDSDVTQMITTGAIGNGNFGTLAQALFTTRSATFHYKGIEKLQGKNSNRFDYNVPQMLSGYRIRVSTASAIVGFHGSFYADAATHDIQRIEVNADDLPPALMLSSTSDKIEYAVARVGEGDFLLPAQSELSMVGWNGAEEHNHVKFSSCREFSGESVVTFGDAPESKPDAAAVPTRVFDLPEGLDVQLSLVKEIDLHNAAIGDPVYARIDRDVKEKNEILIPKGATATGRIVRLEKNETYSVLGVEFPEIESPGLLAHMKGGVHGTAGILPLSARRQVHTRSATLPGEGIIPVNATQRHIFKGCIIFWRT
jgi:hypothetical protein